MSEQIQEYIPSRDLKKESPEIQRLFSRANEKFDLMIFRLELRGMKLEKRYIQSMVLPLLEDILDNQNITKNPELLSTIGRHLEDFLHRIGSLDQTKLEAYQVQKGVFEDAFYDREWVLYSESQKKGLALKDMIQTAFDRTLQPQMELMNRAFQRRALSYDYENFAGYQGALGKIDTFLPQGKSILDFVLEQGQGKLDLSKNQKLSYQGMEYIIDALAPPGSLWLKQMAKNGRITPATRVKGYTDAVVNGKTIDTVTLLMFYQSRTQSFQAQESEINNIRNRATSQDKTDMLPRESNIFPELAPTRESRLEQLTRDIDSNNISQTEAIRKLGKLILEDILYTGGGLASSVTGVTSDGTVLNTGERWKEGVKGVGGLGVSILLWETIIGKIVGKILGGAWKMTTKQRNAIKQMLSSVVGSSAKILKSL